MSSIPDGQASPERVVEGVGVAPGISIGPAFLYRPQAPEVRAQTIDEAEVDAEVELFDRALQRAEQSLDTVLAVAREKLADDDLGIFEAQKMMLSDAELVEPVRRRIRENHETAGHAVTAVLRAYRQRLEEADSAYLQERGGELDDVRDRILRALRRDKVAASIDPNSIVVAEELTATDVLRFNRRGLLGCVSDRGGATSHVSIIARALGVPAVVGTGSAVAAVEPHDTVIIDGQEGRLVVHPSAETLDLYRDRRARYENYVEEQTRVASLPSTTQDDHAVTLRANVEFGEELDVLDTYGAEGIGLLRTEMLFLTEADTSLSEDEQFAVYRDAARAAGSDGATIRLFDLGGDKVMPLEHREDNPFLGWRGVRVLLDRPDFLRPQLRALLRANAHGTVRVLVPMITQLDELRRIRQLLQDEADRLAADGVEHDPGVDVGAMVEVPTVALQADAFAEAADFLSIGSNDLTQYVLAVDRGNDLVADRYDALHPAVLSLIRRTVRAGAEAGIPVTLCGEIASDGQAVPILVGLGLDALSASPTYLPAVKRVIRTIRHTDAQSLAQTALTTPDAPATRRLAREWIAEHGVDS
jgi:phosphotransferase system enzyme I (PtsI)